MAKAEAWAAKFHAERWSESHDLWSEEYNIDEWRPNDSYGHVKTGNKDWKLKIVDGAWIHGCGPWRHGEKD